MNDFFPNAMSINKKAQAVLVTVDESLDLYKQRHKNPDHLHLYKAQHTTLDGSLKTASNGNVSLDTHTYRGVQLLRMP